MANIPASIELLTVANIKELEGQTLLPGYLKPVGIQKLSWLASNPVLESNDPVVVLAHREGILVGNLFLLGFLYENKQDELTKAFWLKEWWVGESEKESKTASLLFFEAMRGSGQQLIAGPYTKKTEDFYENEKMFSKIGAITIHGFFFSLDHHIILQKIPALKFLRPVLSLVSKVSFTIFKGINSGKISRLTQGIVLEESQRIDEESWQFIHKHSKKDWVNRTADFINWRLSETQLAFAGPKKRTFGFVTGPGINLVAIDFIKVLKAGEMIGFLAVYQSADRADIRICISRDEKDQASVCAAALQRQFKMAARPIFSIDSSFASSIRTNFKTLFIHRNQKYLVCFKRMRLEPLGDKIIRDLDCT